MYQTMATSESQMRSSFEQSSKTPGIKPGGIAGSTNLINWPTSAKQSRGHSIKRVYLCFIMCSQVLILQMCYDFYVMILLQTNAFCMLMILCSYICNKIKYNIKQ